MAPVDAVQEITADPLPAVAVTLVGGLAMLATGVIELVWLEYGDVPPTFVADIRKTYDVVLVRPVTSADVAVPLTLAGLVVAAVHELPLLLEY